MRQRLFEGVLSSLLLAAASPALAATGGGDYAIQEHELVPAYGFKPGADLTEGDITRDENGATSRFIAQHLADDGRWTHPFIGPSLVPELAASTAVAASNDPQSSTFGFAQRLDLDLYWLQVRLPAFITQNGGEVHVDQIDFDALLPWRISDRQRLGVLVGTSLLTRGGGVGDYRFQLLYGFDTAGFDVQLRGGYSLGSRHDLASPLDTTAVLGPEASEAAFVYGAVAGYRIASWLRVGVEAQAVSTLETHRDAFRFLPGVELYPAGDERVRLGLAALLQDQRDATDSSLHGTAIGGLVNVGYTFF